MCCTRHSTLRGVHLQTTVKLSGVGKEWRGGGCCDMIDVRYLDRTWNVHVSIATLLLSSSTTVPGTVFTIHDK